MRALATVPSRLGALLPDAIDGHRVGWFPVAGMIYAEGHPSDSGLAAAGSLGERLDRLVTAIEDAGVPLPRARRRYEPVGDLDSCLLQMIGPGFGGLRRLDVTADLETTPAQGQAFMTASLDLLRTRSPHGLRPVYGKGGHLETVALHGSRGILSRLYDKGIESGEHARWTMPRLEAQIRFKSDQRLTVEGFDGLSARHRFMERFRPLWAAGEGVTIVTDILELRDQLVQAVEHGELTFARAERILGAQLMLAGAPGRRLTNRQTDWRRRKLIAESGYLLTDAGEPSSVSMDEVHELLNDVTVWTG